MYRVKILKLGYTYYFLHSRLPLGVQAQDREQNSHRPRTDTQNANNPLTVSRECHPRDQVEQGSAHKNETKNPFEKPPIYGESAEDYKA